MEQVSMNHAVSGPAGCGGSPPKAGHSTAQSRGRTSKCRAWSSIWPHLTENMAGEMRIISAAAPNRPVLVYGAGRNSHRSTTDNHAGPLYRTDLYRRHLHHRPHADRR